MVCKEISVQHELAPLTNEETHVVQLVDDKLTVAGIVLPLGNSPLQWLEEGMVHLHQGKESLLVATLSIY